MKKDLSIDVKWDLIDSMKQRVLEKKKKKKSLASSSQIEPPLALPFTDFLEEDPSRKRKKAVVGSSANDENPFDDVVKLSFEMDASFLSEPNDNLREARKILLPEDEKRYSGFETGQVFDRGMLGAIQAMQALTFLEKDMKKVASRERGLRADLEEAQRQIEWYKDNETKSVSRITELEAIVATMEETSKRECEKCLLIHEEQQSLIHELEEAKLTAEQNGSSAMQYQLMKDFLQHQGAEWDPETVVKSYEELMELMKDEDGGEEAEEEYEEDDGEEEEKDDNSEE